MAQNSYLLRVKKKKSQRKQWFLKLYVQPHRTKHVEHPSQWVDGKTRGRKQMQERWRNTLKPGSKRKNNRGLEGAPRPGAPWWHSTTANASKNEQNQNSQKFSHLENVKFSAATPVAGAIKAQTQNLSCNWSVSKSTGHKESWQVSSNN